jgi:hypothetical protein
MAVVVTFLWLSGFSEMKSAAGAHTEPNVVAIGAAMMRGTAGFIWGEARNPEKS